MSRSIFVLSMIIGSLFSGFIGMLVGDLLSGGSNEGIELCGIIGFLLPLIGLVSCWYYDYSHK